MHPRSTRRRFAALVAASLPAFAGCSGLDSDAAPGSLTIDNRDDSSHRVTVTVRERRRDTAVETATPETPVASGDDRTEVFELTSGEERVIDDFLTRTGRYWVRAKTETSPVDSVTAEVTESSASSAGQTGDALELRIGDDGSAWLRATRYD